MVTVFLRATVVAMAMACWAAFKGEGACPLSSLHILFFFFFFPYVFLPNVFKPWKACFGGLTRIDVTHCARGS